MGEFATDMPEIVFVFELEGVQFEILRNILCHLLSID